jgi:hypothetical protein
VNSALTTILQSLLFLPKPATIGRKSEAACRGPCSHDELRVASDSGATYGIIQLGEPLSLPNSGPSASPSTWFVCQVQGVSCIVAKPKRAECPRLTEQTPSLRRLHRFHRLQSTMLPCLLRTHRALCSGFTVHNKMIVRATRVSFKDYHSDLPLRTIERMKTAVVGCVSVRVWYFAWTTARHPPPL